MTGYPHTDDETGTLIEFHRGREPYLWGAIAACFALAVIATVLAIVALTGDDGGWSQADVWEICASGVIDECTITVTP